MVDLFDFLSFGALSWSVVSLSSMVSTRGWAQGLLAKVEVAGGAGEEPTRSVNVGIGVDIGVDIVDLVDAGEGAAGGAVRVGMKPDTSSMYFAGGQMV